MSSLPHRGGKGKPRRSLPAKTQPSAAWRSKASALADWAFMRLANRTDIHGRYRPAAGRPGQFLRVVRKGKLTRKPLIEHFCANDIRDLIGLPAVSPTGTSHW